MGSSNVLYHNSGLYTLVTLQASTLLLLVGFHGLSIPDRSLNCKDSCEYFEFVYKAFLPWKELQEPKPSFTKPI